MRNGWAAIGLAATIAGGVAAPAEAAHFNFHAVEFVPADERLPAAQAFLRRRAPPGTPMPAAIAAVRRADAHCAKRPEPGGAIVCRYATVVSNSIYDMPIGDVTWTVRLYPAADGTVAQATVKRERIGD